MDQIPSNLESPNVLLRAIMPSDAEYIVKWAADSEIRRLTAETEPLTLEKARDFIDMVRADESRLWFMIIDKKTQKPIGECGLLRIFRPWNTADLSMIIAEKSQWGKGAAGEAMRILLDIAFNSLRLHRLSIGVLDYNVRALRFYRRFGFREEGRQLDGYFSDGAHHDFIMMSLLEGQYRQANP